VTVDVGAGVSPSRVGLRVEGLMVGVMVVVGHALHVTGQYAAICTGHSTMGMACVSLAQAWAQLSPESPPDISGTLLVSQNAGSSQHSGGETEGDMLG